MQFSADFPNLSQRPRSAPRLLAVSGLFLAAAFSVSTTWSQQANRPRPANRPGAARPGSFPGVPFGNPQEFMEQFMGKESPEDREAIEKVPISIKEEQRIGTEMVEAYLGDLKRKGTKVLRDGEDVEYLSQLVKLLRPQLKNRARYPKIEVLLADGPQTDARSFPGGTLIFFRGMLDFAENEAALVGVVGHELSHLDHGHQLGQVRRLKLAQQSFSGQGKNFSVEKMMQSGALMMRTFARPFRPEEEAEADSDGARWCFLAGYDPLQMAELFLRLHQRDGERPDIPFNFFQTHPFHRDRYDAVVALDQELRRQHPRTDLYVGRENLERRIPRDKQRFPE